MRKKALRLNYSTFRENTSRESLQHSSLSIANQLLGLPIWQASYYHIFLPIFKKKEVDTSYVLSILQGKDKHVVVPKVMGDTQMNHFLLTDNTRLVTNKWGVPEPDEGIEIPVKKLDVVFVPLLAFDQQGHRVGYGKGFYDRFLGQCRKDVVKVGLSQFEAIPKISDCNANDIRLDYCVTPKIVYKFELSPSSS